jgi:subtilisin family serine protease
VTIGIVDTGVDLTHPDLRNPDGTTRVTWLVDMASEPIGTHPDAEARCDAAGISCAVLSSDDIDAALVGGGGLPADHLGHGTHVTSLAAGNGQSTSPPEYVGMAPEASLVVVRATDQVLSVTDANVLSAADMVFWLVDTYQPTQGIAATPVVVNLSLGSDFGPHDGSSALGQGLASLVTDDHPGRAIVVAAGNSGGLLTGFGDFPEPLGVHTNVSVVGTARVPIVSPVIGGASTVTADILTWVEMAERDQIAVGLERRDGTVLVSPVGAGDSRSHQMGDYEVLVANQDAASASILPGDRKAAVVVVTGRFPANETFALRFEGEGTAEIWVQSEGDLSPAHSFGSLVPEATKQGTINSPGSNPNLIAVGATVNRVDWTDRDGEPVEVSMGGVTPRVDSSVFFSSAGPNADGVVKPDIVAPGAWVIGAMSAGADPLESDLSIFSQGAPCSPAPACAVVDDAHAATSGTSMAAPIVAGAVALLLERDPTLTQPEILGLLRAGARPLTGDVASHQQVGPGALDVVGALLALDERVRPHGRVPAAASRLVMGSALATPDPALPVRGLAQLRDAGGEIADGFDESALTFETGDTGTDATLSRVAPGLWAVTAAARSGTGGGRLALRLRYAGTVIAEAELPIAVDVSTARHGFFAQGGCAVGRRPSPGLGALGLITALAWLGRRSRRGARGARSPDRTDRPR